MKRGRSFFVYKAFGANCEKHGEHAKQDSDPGGRNLVLNYERCRHARSIQGAVASQGPPKATLTPAIMAKHELP